MAQLAVARQADEHTQRLPLWLLREVGLDDILDP